MYHLLTKLYFQFTGKKLMYLSYTTVGHGLQQGIPQVLQLKFVCGFFNMVDLCSMRCVVKRHHSWRISTLQCACQFLIGLGTSTHVCSQSILIVISSSGMFAMLSIGAGPSKLWQKLRCNMMFFYCESRVHSSAVDHSQTLVLLLTSNYKTSIIPI